MLVMYVEVELDGERLSILYLRCVIFTTSAPCSWATVSLSILYLRCEDVYPLRMWMPTDIHFQFSI